MEIYAKTGMSSTVNWIRTICNRKKITCKTTYNTSLNHEHFPPPTAERKLIEYGFRFQERRKIYSLPFHVTNEVKLSVFQYKIVHNILYTNKILHKMKKEQPDCPYIHGIDQTPLHLFVECPIAKCFWNKSTMWYNVTCRGNIALEQNEIIYSVLKYTSSGLTHNIQATISAFWLAENMSINPKSMNSAISPVQKSEIECKTLKLKMIDCSYIIELGQTKWRTKIKWRSKLCKWNFNAKTFITKQNTKLSKNY